MTASKLLASFWIDSETRAGLTGSPMEKLRRFAAIRHLAVSDDVLAQAARYIACTGDVEQWVVLISISGHPHAIWAFMLDAMDAAQTDEHLWKIAYGLADTLLAHNGSMFPHFEARAARDARFARMLTAAWRHRISDRVWTRLRAIQASVPDPPPQMIALEHGAEWGAGRLTPEDRATEDKGMYVRGPGGDWVKRRRAGA